MRRSADAQSVEPDVPFFALVANYLSANYTEAVGGETGYEP